MNQGQRSERTRWSPMLVGLALTMGCGSSTQEDASGAREGESALAAGDGVRSFEAVYFRGTPNGWGLTPMERGEDHVFTIEVEFGSSSRERFKFDVSGDWSRNYGDNDRDGRLDRSGADIPVEAGKTYVISLYGHDLTYSVLEKTYEAELRLELPDGLDPELVRMHPVNLYANDTLVGSAGIYTETDEQGTKVYVPLTGLRLGAYTAKFDHVIEHQRYVGEASFLVEDSTPAPVVPMPIVAGSMEDLGSVIFTVYANHYENGSMVATPIPEVGVFLGDWQAGNRLGQTDEGGNATVYATAGPQLFSVFKMTSSHSALMRSGIAVEVQAGGVSYADVQVAPWSVEIAATTDVGYGNALYITGASPYLGDWRTATKLTWDSMRRRWEFRGSLPVGLPFKIVRSAWVPGPTIDTSSVRWERGPNRTVSEPHGFYMIQMTVSPVF